MSEKASEGKFFGPDKLQNQTNDGKGKEKRKSAEEERRKEKIAMVALLGIIMATLEIVLDELLDTKGSSGNASLITPEFSVRNEVLLPNYCVNTKRRDSHHWNNIYIFIINVMVTNLSTLIGRDISCTVSGFGQAEVFYLRPSSL